MCIFEVLGMLKHSQDFAHVSEVMGIWFYQIPAPGCGLGTPQHSLSCLSYIVGLYFHLHAPNLVGIWVYFDIRIN